MWAGATIGAAERCRCAAGFCPCLLRGTRFDQKKTLIVHAIALLSHPPDHSVSDINRITCHIAFVPPGEPYAVFAHHSLLLVTLPSRARKFCLILNNPEKNYCQGRNERENKKSHYRLTVYLLTRRVEVLLQ